MKKYKLMVLVAALMVMGTTFFTACEDMLETKNYGDMSPQNFFKSEGDLDAAVTGLYLPCTTNWGYGDGGTGKWYNALFNSDMGSYLCAGMVSTDIMCNYSVNEWDKFTVGPSYGGALNNTYNVIRFVARATDVINQIEHSNGTTEEVRLRKIAETKTLRAFYMYTLLDFFGPVNVKLDPEKLNDNTIEPRPDHASYVGYIEKDLADAISTESFPDKYNDDASNWGRMSKAIAYGIRMRLHLHEKDYQAVKQDCENLMSMGYSLMDNYEDVFNEDRNAESIWSIPSNTASDNFYVTEVLPGDFKKGYFSDGKPFMRGDEKDYLAGWQIYCMRWEFYDTFSKGDVRRNTIITSYETNDGIMKSRSDMKGAIPVKFTNSAYYSFGCQKAHPVIRYADVLLAYAEADNELNGPTASGISALRQVTDRAHVSIPAEALSSKESLRDYILLERGHELFAEGVRRQDLIRYGEYIKRARERGNNVKDYQVLYPIPQFAITEAGGILKQNEGYTE